MVIKRLIDQLRRSRPATPHPTERDNHTTPVAAKPVWAPKPVDPVFVAEMARHIDYLCDHVPLFRQQLERDRTALEWWPCLPPECYQDKDVLDLGCGTGAGVATFLERGARFVWGVDPALDGDLLSHLRVLPRAKFTAAELTTDLAASQQFDLVYAQFVTEHLRHMPGDFDTVFALLKPGGRFVAIHDNYYSPMGGHDHAFVGPIPGEPRRMHFKGVACWDSPRKCAASEEWRRTSERVYGTVANITLTPEDCSRCPYYQRSHVWAHLLFQDSFPVSYRNDFFISSRCGGVNKVTPFQLRQFLIEAGFRVTAWLPDKVANEPPARLTEQFHVNDLQTAVIVFAADKPLQGYRRLPLPRVA
jgi:SAM-dependent methyltransferase